MATMRPGLKQNSQHLFRVTANSIFAIHGDLDGENSEPVEFVEREQFIGLLIGGEDFLLPISAVREIIMLIPITFVPNAPRFIEGVINLRGTILPAVNMRKMMGFTRGEILPAARMIVVRFQDVSFALLVDGITYVTALLPNEIQQQSLPGKGNGADLIGGIAKHGNKVCGIIDMARIVRELTPTNEASADPRSAAGV